MERYVAFRYPYWLVTDKLEDARKWLKYKDRKRLTKYGRYRGTVVYEQFYFVDWRLVEEVLGRLPNPASIGEFRRKAEEAAKWLRETDGGGGARSRLATLLLNLVGELESVEIRREEWRPAPRARIPASTFAIEERLFRRRSHFGGIYYVPSPRYVYTTLLDEHGDRYFLYAEFADTIWYGYKDAMDQLNVLRVEKVGTDELVEWLASPESEKHIDKEIVLRVLKAYARAKQKRPGMSYPALDAIMGIYMMLS